MQLAQRQTDGERWALIAVANPMQRRAAQTVLEQEGFTTVSANDTGSALTALENQVGPFGLLSVDFAFSLLLVDFDLPGQGGLEVVEVYKYLTGGAQAAAIVRLVEQTEEASVSCLAAGVDECLPIPTDTEQLRAAVRTLLPQAALTRATG